MSKKVTHAKGNPSSKLTGCNSFRAWFPARVHKNNAHLVSGFCDFSRALVNHAIPQPIEAGISKPIFKQVETDAMYIQHHRSAVNGCIVLLTDIPRSLCSAHQLATVLYRRQHLRPWSCEAGGCGGDVRASGCKNTPIIFQKRALSEMDHCFCLAKRHRCPAEQILARRFFPEGMPLAAVLLDAQKYLYFKTTIRAHVHILKLQQRLMLSFLTGPKGANTKGILFVKSF